jgi:predicted dehydrogenase
MTVRVGMIGLGAVAQRFVEVFTKHPLTEVTAVCDVSEERVSEARAHFPAAQGYTDYKQLLQDSSLDLVYVAVPPKYHHDVVMDAIVAGKHILCEKPLANSLLEAKEMMDAAFSAGIVHAMNFPSYYRQAPKEFDRLVKEGFLGDLCRVEVKAHFHQWPRPWQHNSWIGKREQGGFVREVMPHQIQLIQKLFGNIKVNRSFLEFPEDPEACETGLIARLELTDGTPVLMEGISGIAHPEEISFTAFGTKGTLCLRNWTNLEVAGYAERLSQVLFEEQNHLYDLVEQTLNAMAGKESMIFDFKVGYEVQEVLEEILKG